MLQELYLCNLSGGRCLFHKSILFPPNPSVEELCCVTGDTAGGCMVLDFEEVPLEVLNSIIQFIYMGEFEVGRETLPQVLEASKCMKLDDLTILCEHVLKALRGSVIDERAKKPVLPKVSV